MCAIRPCVGVTTWSLVRLLCSTLGNVLGTHLYSYPPVLVLPEGVKTAGPEAWQRREDSLHADADISIKCRARGATSIHIWPQASGYLAHLRLPPGHACGYLGYPWWTLDTTKFISAYAAPSLSCAIDTDPSKLCSSQLARLLPAA